MRKEKRDKHFIKKPIYPGGPSAMKAFITEQLQYPEAAAAAKISGTVVVRFEIDHKGTVTDTKVISSLGYGCDEEAHRVVRLLKFKVPSNRKLRAVFHKTIKIHFRPGPAALPAPPTQPVGYTYTLIAANKQPPASQPSTKPGPGYSYEITIR